MILWSAWKFAIFFNEITQKVQERYKMESKDDNGPYNLQDDTECPMYNFIHVYCLSKKSGPILYSNVVYKEAWDFLEIQYKK